MTKRIIFDSKKILVYLLQHCTMPRTVTSKHERNFRDKSFVFCLISLLQANTAHLRNHFSNFRNFRPRKNLIIVSDVTVLSPVSLPVQFCTPLEVKFSIRTRKENRYGILLIVSFQKTMMFSKEKSTIYTLNKNKRNR